MKTPLQQLAMIILLLGIVPAFAADAPKTPVMILGTFHFQGSATDGVSVTMGDMLSPQRQAEIQEVVDRLADFRPTQIMIEATPEHAEHLNATYRDYVAGKHDLTANEIQQLGMRLAKRLGHEKLYAVDYHQGMDFERMMKAGQEAGQQDILQWFQKTIADVEQSLANAQSPDKTVLDALRFHNGPWAHDSNNLYLQLAVLGGAENPAGAEVIGSWYERNLHIYANIARAVEGPDARVLVIYGSGHLPLLSDFFEENPNYELVSALDALGKPAGD